MKKNAILFLLISLLLSACATNHHNNDEGSLETYNRAVFDFNMQLDKYILKPVAKGYISITTPGIRRSVTSVLTNIWEPFSAANHLLQGNLHGASINISRFAINTTVGVLGAFDVAKSVGFEPERTGFDETLAFWCIPDGPYIVLPFTGPSTPRTMAAMVVNNYANPVIIASNSIDSDGRKNAVKYGYEAARVIVIRANAMPITDDLEKNSVDYYTAIKTSFLQNRNKIKCFLGEEEVSYDFAFEDEDF